MDDIELSINEPTLNLGITILFSYSYIPSTPTNFISLSLYLIPVPLSFAHSQENIGIFDDL